LKLREKLDQIITIKRVSYVAMILNMTSIVLGIIYLLTPIYNIVWDVSGIIFLITLFVNILFIYLNSLKLNKTTKMGNRLNISSYFFLIIILISLFCMAQGNTQITQTYFNNASIGWVILVYFSYFGMLAFGFTFSLIDILNFKNEDLWNPEINGSLNHSDRTIKIKKILKIGTKIFCYLALVLGIIICYAMFAGGLEIFSWAIMGLLSFYTLFFAFAFLGISVLLLMVKDRKNNPRSYYAVGLIGLTLAVCFLLPLCLTSYTVYNAEIGFSQAFGSDWRNNIDQNDQIHFIQTPFSIPQYFLGIPPKDCIVITDQLYYQNATEGISLYFDAYLPPNGGVGLPGQNSTIIKLHGGGWILGEKGQGNFIQMNKYFAAQGYVVFDIEYGLDRNLLQFINPPPAHVIGDFTIDQIVRHVGAFTYYIAENYTKFGANLSRVFISGGSAGGHLTMAAGLGIWSGNYTHIFNDTLTIRGIIPTNPANGWSPFFNVYGSPDLVYPEYLINVSSPPCLLFQGTADALCVPVTQKVKNLYSLAGSSKCIVLWAPYAGHGGYKYYSGYFNQPYLYYLERFLYLAVNNKI